MRISDWSSDVCSSDLWRHEHIFLRERHRGRPVDFAVEILLRDRQSRARRALDRFQKLPIAIVRRHRDLGDRHQYVALGVGSAAFGKGEVDAVVGAALGDQALRAVERIDAELVPAALLHQLRSEEHTSELQSLMRISYAVFCSKKKKK